MEILNKPGSIIDSWCGKCKLVLAHTIEAMVGVKPVRVQCNTCKSQHSYKPNPPEARPARKGEAREGSSKPARPGRNRYNTLLNSQNPASAKPYSPQNTYAQGEVIEHPTFGRGIVTAAKDGAKVEVLFENGAKTLVHAR